MTYEIVKAQAKEAIAISKLLYDSLQNGVDKNFDINKEKLVDHVFDTIVQHDGFAVVLKHEGKVVGCFMGELTKHRYATGYIATELGVYIHPEHRGENHFQEMLDQFICWSSKKPDVLMTTFSIGQLNATTPWVRAQLKKRNFIKGDENYYLLRN
ncbi:MAG: GNAT family N-acetyltransferase [Pirellulales bacterium]|nr:GNAT family N-acetyltransferase [Pirellulales bacterium]